MKIGAPAIVAAVGLGITGGCLLIYIVRVRRRNSKKTKKPCLGERIKHIDDALLETLSKYDQKLIDIATEESYITYARNSLDIEGDTRTVEAIRDASEYAKSLNLPEITLPDILEIHRRLFSDIDPVNAGQFRVDADAWIDLGNGEAYKAPRSADIDRYMSNFVTQLNTFEGIDVKTMALMKLDFVYIHPFYDGNGPVSRALFAGQLCKIGYPWIAVLKKDELKYHQVMEQMAKDGDYKEYLNFMVSCVEQTVRRFQRRLKILYILWYFNLIK